MTTIDEVVKCKEELRVELVAAMRKFQADTGLLPRTIIGDWSKEMGMSCFGKMDTAKIDRLACEIDLRI